MKSNRNQRMMILCPIRLIPIFIITFLGIFVIIRGHSASQLEEGVSFIHDSEGLSTKTMSTEAELKALKFKGMVEHKVYVALDGLKKEQPAEVQKSSLYSLLSVSCSNPGRRILRSQRLAKPVLGALQDLDFNDNPTNLAALRMYKILTKKEGKADKTMSWCLEEEKLDASIRYISSNLPVVDIPDATCQSKELDMPPCQAIQEQEGTWFRRTFWRINAFIFNHNDTHETPQRALMDADEVHREEMFYCKIFLVVIWINLLVGLPVLSFAFSDRAQQQLR